MKGIKLHTCKQCGRGYWTTNALAAHDCEARPISDTEKHARAKAKAGRKPTAPRETEYDDSRDVARAWLAIHGGILEDEEGIP